MDLGGLEQAVVSIHMMLAHFLQVPELEMEEDEAKRLLSATQRVGSHYASGAVPQKVADWVSFATVIGEVYGTRVVAARMRMASDAAKDVTPRQPQPTQPSPQPAPANGMAKLTPEQSLAMQNAMHQHGR